MKTKYRLLIALLYGSYTIPVMFSYCFIGSRRTGQVFFSLSLHAPAVQRQALHGAEYLAAQIGVLPGEGGQKILDLLAVAGLVLGAGARHHGQGKALAEIGHPLFPGVEQGADLGHPGAGHIGHRLEAGEPPLEEEAHQEGFHRVVEVVPQGQLVEAVVPHKVVERPPAHFGAQGAGVVLLADVKDDLPDVRFQYGVGQLQPPAELLHRAEVHVREPRVHGDRLQMEGEGVEAAQVMQRHEQHQRVLSPADAHQNTVVPADHAVVVHAAADKAGKGIQCVHIASGKI